MNFKNIDIINVFYMHGTDKLLMGRLALKERKIFFEYNSEFIATNLQLSPFKLPLKSGVMVCEDRLFEGLFGVFDDSLPDGWGRLLLDRKLMQLGINPKGVSVLDRLSYVGSNGMGALMYEPEIKSDSVPTILDLDQINNEAQQFQATNDDQFVDELIKINGSSAGARPKALINLGDEDWLIKFRNSADPIDAGPIEYAYHLMALRAKLDVPEAKLFSSKNTLGFFGVKRFDHSNGERLHMHTVGGLLHADYRLPSLDYSAIMQATMWLTKDVRQCLKQFRAAVFNVLTHNRDDHAKNFSFLMEANCMWCVSPAYDLTFSSGPAGEHSTSIMHEGKTPKLKHLLQLAEIAQIEVAQAHQIIDEVKIAVDQWPIFAEQAGVQMNSATGINDIFKQISKELFSKN